MLDVRFVQEVVSGSSLGELLTKSRFVAEVRNCETTSKMALPLANKNQSMLYCLYARIELATDHSSTIAT